MSGITNYSKVSVLIVGAGPAGLAAAIQLKVKKPSLDICVIEKGSSVGSHNLSGAVLESQPLFTLLNSALPGWQNTDHAKEIFANKIDKDDVLFFAGQKISFSLSPLVQLAKLFHFNFAQMTARGDYAVSISKLTKWLGLIAQNLGVEILTGFAANDIILDEAGQTVGVKLVDQGLDREGRRQPNFLEGEIINADFVILAEGCDGLVTEKFIAKASLQRQSAQLFSFGVKELIKVSPEQYKFFTAGRVVHAMGYPLWTPLVGPAMFGGGIIYAMDNDCLAVGIIVGLDFKYCDFNPQDAFARFKEHKFIKKFVDGGTVIEAGAKMIPEGGLYAIPRDRNGYIGKSNCLIAGDSAGFVNMLKIRGLHNAVDSGIQAAKAIIESLSYSRQTAARYTTLVNCSNIAKEMESARNFRQTVARFWPLAGMPLAVFGGILPKFKIEQDYKVLTAAKYRYKPANPFDKAAFTALASTGHREDQPCHLSIINRNTCAQKCVPKFDAPCITFCPAGVYDTVAGQVKPANPSNCLHCKTCQRKCPFDNIRWTAPEGGGGPKYKRM
jgi:electron-transferring-flavoprotein dehydrogenase